MKRKKVRLSPTAVRAHIREQAEFLERSGRLFDEGLEAEAKRIAVSVRTLIHNTQRSRSLLAQLDSFGWRFADCAFPYKPTYRLSHFGLLQIELSSGPSSARFRPHYSDLPFPIAFKPFHDWWNLDVVFKDTEGVEMTRRDLVLAVANKDGGAHVDPELDGDYAALAEGTALGVVFCVDGREFTANPVPASVRQIGHEMLLTLKTNGLA